MARAATPARAVRGLLDAAGAVAGVGTRHRDEQKLDTRVSGVPVRVPLHGLARAVGKGDAPVPWILQPGRRVRAWHDEDEVASRTLRVGGHDLDVYELSEAEYARRHGLIERAKWEHERAARVTHPARAWKELAEDLHAIRVEKRGYTSTLDADRGRLVATASSDADGYGVWPKQTFGQEDQRWSRTGTNEAEITLPHDAGGAWAGKASFPGEALRLLLRGAAASAGKGDVTAHIATDRPLRLSWAVDGIGAETLLAPLVTA